MSFLLNEGRIKSGVYREKRKTLIDPKLADSDLKSNIDFRWKGKIKGDGGERKKVVEAAGVGGILNRNTLTVALLQYRVANEKLDYEAKQGRWILRDEVREKVGKILIAA